MIWYAIYEWVDDLAVLCTFVEFEGVIGSICSVIALPIGQSTRPTWRGGHQGLGTLFIKNSNCL